MQAQLLKERLRIPSGLGAASAAPGANLTHRLWLASGVYELHRCREWFARAKDAPQASRSQHTRCFHMNIEGFIDEVIKLGSQSGLSALNPIQRKVFLISEAEVSCDINGIDSFIDRYESSILLEAAEASS
jgi:hypothetical protein